jgi:predicted P-loop ATPase
MTTSAVEYAITYYAPNPTGRPTAQASRGDTLTVPLAELIDSVTDYVDSDRKDLAPAWSPITYTDGIRKSHGALAVCALVYDLDHSDPNDTTTGPPTNTQLEALSARLEHLGWVYAIHETYTAGRWRLVVPLASPVHPKEYPAARVWGLEQLGNPPADPATGDLARLFYAPSRPTGTERRSTSGGTILADFKSHATHLDPHVGASPHSTHPEGSNFSPEDSPSKFLGPGGSNFSAEPFDLEILATEVSKSLSPHRDAMKSLIDGTLRVPPGSRENVMHPLMCAMAQLRAAPSEKVMETMVRRVLEVREGAEEHLEEWVSKALDSYKRGADYAGSKSAAASLAQKFFEDKAREPGNEWMTLLERTGKDGGGPVKANEMNVITILRNDEAFRGFLRWNVLKQRAEIIGGVLNTIPESARDDLGVHLAAWFQGSVHKCAVSRDMAGACMQSIALENPYDPVREYLDGLPKWDGVARLGNLLKDYAGALGNQNWIRTVSTKFFISAIARAMEPGCQVDTVLVLMGKQGGGKTSLVRVMGAGFHVETSLDLHNKDAVMTAAGNWLVELGELASLRKSDIESSRNFITRKEDQIRLPYGRSIRTIPRRCVFIGTTNSTTPLQDPDGSRRYWVVAVGRVDTAGLEKVRGQMWAEALHYYKQGVSWWLDDAETEIAENEARAFEAEDPVRQTIIAWLSTNRKRPEYISTHDIATSWLGWQSYQINTATLSNIGRELNKLGWPRKKKRSEGTVITVYAVPRWQENEEASLDTDA